MKGKGEGGANSMTSLASQVIILHYFPFIHSLDDLCIHSLQICIHICLETTLGTSTALLAFGISPLIQMLPEGRQGSEGSLKVFG